MTKEPKLEAGSGEVETMNQAHLISVPPTGLRSASVSDGGEAGTPRLMQRLARRLLQARAKSSTAMLITICTLLGPGQLAQSALPNGFNADRWTGAWGSDGPIFTGDLNGDGKTDVFMWRDADKSWTINLSTGSGFDADRWTGAWGSDGPICSGELKVDGKTDVFMWRDADKSWTINLSTGSGFTADRWTGAWGSDGPIFTGDLNGDGKTDVFMWRDADKSWTINLSTGSGF